jgi:hypothetical protein
VATRMTVTGSRDFVRMAAAFHEAGDKDLKRELDRGCREAGQVLVAAVKARTDEFIPAGFEARWRQSMQAKVEVRLRQSRRAEAVFWAMGKKERRDIKAINAGRLKAPVRGRTRRIKDGSKSPHQDRIRGGLYYNPWHTHAIRPGLVDVPGADAMPDAVRKLDDALGRVATKIERRG